MRQGWIRSSLLLLAVALCGSPALRAEEPEKGGTPDTISAPLKARLSGKGSLDDSFVDVVWQTSPTHLASCKCWGNGLGLWDRAAQFHFSREQTLAIFQMVQKVHFGSLDDSVPEEGDSEGRVRVHVGTASRTVWQMKKGEPGAEELEQLAETVLRACEKPAQTGVRMENMQDGLKKLAAGTLAPEALEVVFKRATDHPAAATEQENWLVQINGRKVLDRVSTKDKANPRQERSLTLSEKDYKALVAMLEAGSVWKMRESLYATQYSNLRVVVLNKTRNIQARQFAEMSPTKYGEEQTTFEHIFDWGVALHKRALKEGKTVVRPPATSPVHRDEKEKAEEEEREREKEKAEKE